jgi:hypothetical protein
MDVARVKDHVPNGSAVRIISISINPLLTGWEPGADGSFGKGLDAGRRGSPFIWCENLVIQVT